MINKIIESENMELQCLGCDPAVSTCPYGCQENVDSLYEKFYLFFLFLNTISPFPIIVVMEFV